MRYPAVVAVFVFCSLIYSVHSADARPGTRYDERSKMCRVLGDGGELDWESDHWGLGAVKFKEVCKSCHTRDNDKGAPFLYMESYGSQGWNNVFSRRQKKCARDGSWDVLSEAELQMVNDYLYRNANDTYDPNDADSCA